MKRYFFICLTLLFNTFAILAQIPFQNDLEVTRISTNFNGTSINNNNLLVYGQGGIILRSSDFGESWSKILLNDSLNIIDMVNDGNSFYGICTNNYLVKSSDNGNSWDKVYLSNSEFYQIYLRNDQIYLLAKNNVQVYNKSIEKIKEIPFQTDTNYYNFALVVDNLVISSGFGKITAINTLNGITKNINLKELGICNDCKVVSKITDGGSNSFYFIMNSRVYKYNLNNDKINEITNLKKTEGASFNSIDGKLYSLYSIKNKYNLDSLFFVQIDTLNNSLLRVNNNEIDRYINNLNFSKLNFYNRDTIISVGKNNLIYMSFDGGVNWNLKSFLGSYGPNLFSIDENNSIVLANYAQFFHTNNSGVTWLPQIGYSRKFFDNPAFQYPTNYGGTFNFKDKNNGYIYVDPDYVGDTNIVYTNDGGNIVKLKSSYDFYWELEHYSFNYLNKFYIVSYGNIPPGGDYTILFRLNDTLGVENKLVLKNYLFYDIFPIDNQLFSIGKESKDSSSSFSIFKSSDDGVKWNRLNTFNVELSDNDLFWMYTGGSEVDSNIFLFFAKSEKVQNDTLNYILCYLYDIKADNFKEIYKINGIQNYNFYKINDVYYASYLNEDNSGKTIYNLIFTGNINNDIPKWDTIKYNRFTQPILRSNNNDSLFYFSSYDSLSNNSVLFFAKKKKGNHIDENEIIENNEVYMSNPYPMPSIGKFMMRIYWNQKLNIDDIKFELINVMGINCTNSLSSELMKINNYSGILEINATNLISGVYIISCKINGKVYSKSIIIE